MSRWTAPIGSPPHDISVHTAPRSRSRILLSHPERKFRFIGVVRAAAQLQVVNARRASLSERDDVVILEKPALRAASGRAHERALPAVARPDLALYRRRDVACMRGGARRRPWPRSCCVLGLPQLGEQQRQRAVEDGCNIGLRHPMPQQILRLAELLMRFPRDGELHFVLLRCQRLDLRPRLGRLQCRRNCHVGGRIAREMLALTGSRNG